MSNQPTLSFGAKTLLLEIMPKTANRREFIKSCVITFMGATFLGILLESTQPGEARGADCSCYQNCYTDCHGDCGRKTW